MTIKQQFGKYLKEEEGLKPATILGEVSEDFFTVDLVPHYYKTTDGDHVLIDKICCSIFGGVDTPEGGLGCVCFYIGGTIKEKYHKNSFQGEILKKVGVYEKAKEVQEAFAQWRKNIAKKMKKWKKVI